jgi:hypothetical protein
MPECVSVILAGMQAPHRRVLGKVDNGELISFVTEA